MIDKIRVFVKNRKKQKHSFENSVSQHFLFNSLNSVISLCSKNPQVAAELVGEISTYLQKTLEEKNSLIHLEEELEHVLAYINIQKIRFSDRLKIVLDIEDKVQGRIPPFTLQPIVDNAIRHGVLKRKQGGTVSISIKELSYLTRITVKDDGTGMKAGQLDQLLRRSNRLHSIYKVNRALIKSGAEGLKIESAYNVGTAVVIELRH